ncbi:MAG: DUF1648 domain-containing protein [Ignavibacteriales bacterium]|nr:DUF1648 domain-containing protein [Ignavibacteriales bacterium]
MKFKTKDRPRHVIPISVTDWIAEGVTAIVFLAITIIFLFRYPSVNDKVAMHYDLTGNIDRMGDKSGVFFFFGLIILLYAGMTIAQKFPHTFNYLTEITEENAKRQYTTAIRMIRWLKLMLVVLFSFIILRTIFPRDISNEVFIAVIITFIAATFIQMIGYFIKSGK